MRQKFALDHHVAWRSPLYWFTLTEVGVKMSAMWHGSTWAAGTDVVVTGSGRLGDGVATAVAESLRQDPIVDLGNGARRRHQFRIL